MRALAWACLGLVGLGVAVAAAAETLGAERRWAVYAGGAAGVLLSAAGLPFAWKLSRLADAPARDTRFWKWWGGGVLVRLALLGAFAGVLMWQFKAGTNAGLLTMGAVYLIGMFAEAAWVAAVFFKAAKQGKAAGEAERREGS